MSDQATGTQESLTGAASEAPGPVQPPKMDSEKKKKLILLGFVGVTVLVILITSNLSSRKKQKAAKELAQPVAISSAEAKNASDAMPLVSIGNQAKGEKGSLAPSDDEAELDRLTKSLKLLQVRTAVIQAQQQLEELRLDPKSQEQRQLAVEVAKKAATANQAESESSYYTAVGTNSSESQKAKSVAFSEVTESKPSDSPKPEILRMGTLLDAVLVNKLVTDNYTSPVLAMVDRAYFDPLSKKLLVPSGTRILGKAEAVKFQTASRLAITFDTFQFPNGTSFYVKPEEQALEGLGIFGLQDHVNRHTARILFTAGLVGILTGWNSSQIQSGGGMSGAYSGPDLMRIQANDSMVKTGEQLLSPFLNAVPTITVDEGHRMKIWISRDVPIEPYKEAPNE
jgi:type IV secretory pathway VirB10-like protein